MVAVDRVEGTHRLVGDGSLVEFANRWLAHLEARRFASGTIRGYAFDLLCLSRFLAEMGIDWPQATPTDFFDRLEWQVRPTSRGASSRIGRRIAAGRGRCQPVTSPRGRGSGRSV